MKKKIVLVGAGGHAKSLIDVIESTNKYQIIGLLDQDKKKKGKKIFNYKILGDNKSLGNINKKCKIAAIAFGQIKSPKQRSNMFKILKKSNFALPTIISKFSYISKYSSVGEGCSIFHGVIINSNSKIGKNSIINTRSLIEHDVIIGENCHIAPNAIINGGANIGSGSFIGSGTVIKENAIVKKNSIIPANIFFKKSL